MTGARQTIAVIITFRKSNKKSLERRAGAYRSSTKRHALYFFLTSVLGFAVNPSTSYIHLVMSLLASENLLERRSRSVLCPCNYLHTYVLLSYRQLGRAALWSPGARTVCGPKTGGAPKRNVWLTKVRLKRRKTRSTHV
jgi:hypothetical protein